VALKGEPPLRRDWIVERAAPKRRPISRGAQERNGGARIVQVCGRIAGVEQSSSNIHEDVGLQPRELFPAIIALRPARLASLDRLTVDDGQRRRSFAPLSLAVEHYQKVADLLEQAAVGPGVVISLDPPFAAGLQQIKDGLQQKAESPRTRPACRASGRQERRDQRPCLIAYAQLTGG
jgi:hypothetical protein